MLNWRENEYFKEIWMAKLKKKRKMWICCGRKATHLEKKG